MQQENSPLDLILFLADSHLILSQRNAEICAHGPVLEQDIAITNITLDLLGQARHLYQYAAEMINSQNPSEFVTEDSLAYLRTERAFKNLLLTELPNRDWAHVILRQYIFSVYTQLYFQKLLDGNDERLSAIAEKSLKEIGYHVKWSREWVVRLGDGTEESHNRMLAAIENLWPYTGELFQPAHFETAALLGWDIKDLKAEWEKQIGDCFEEATLPQPDNNLFMQSGGKQGVHTEHLGYLLTDLQYLQRTYPGAEW